MGLLFPRLYLVLAPICGAGAGDHAIATSLSPGDRCAYSGYSGPECTPLLLERLQRCIATKTGQSPCIFDLPDVFNTILRHPSLSADVKAEHLLQLATKTHAAGDRAMALQVVATLRSPRLAPWLRRHHARLELHDWQMLQEGILWLAFWAPEGKVWNDPELVAVFGQQAQAHPMVEARIVAMAVLSVIGDAGHLLPLIARLDHEKQPRARRWLYIALTRLVHRRTAAVLEALLRERREPDTLLRYVIDVGVVGNNRHDLLGALRSLQARLDDDVPNEGLRQSLHNALRHLEASKEAGITAGQPRLGLAYRELATKDADLLAHLARLNDRTYWHEAFERLVRAIARSERIDAQDKAGALLQYAADNRLGRGYLLRRAVEWPGAELEPWLRLHADELTREEWGKALGGLVDRREKHQGTAPPLDEPLLSLLLRQTKHNPQAKTREEMVRNLADLCTPKQLVRLGDNLLTEKDQDVRLSLFAALLEAKDEAANALRGVLRSNTEPPLSMMVLLHLIAEDKRSEFLADIRALCRRLGVRGDLPETQRGACDSRPESLALVEEQKASVRKRGMPDTPQEWDQALFYELTIGVIPHLLEAASEAETGASLRDVSKPLH